VPKQRMIHRYLAWRKTVHLAWRILADVGMVALVVFLATTALQMLIILLPVLFLFGLAGGGGKRSSKSSYDEFVEENDDRMGGQPKSMAPDLFD
jgi:hypothetical protein